jgi:uncharacterized membrane protein
VIWAWGHEIHDGYLCLWCTGMQALILVALGLFLQRMFPRIEGGQQ